VFYVSYSNVSEKSYENSRFLQINNLKEQYRSDGKVVSDWLGLSNWHDIFSHLYWSRLDLGLTQPASDYVTSVLSLVLIPLKLESHS
jgi:hypothetical protein